MSKANCVRFSVLGICTLAFAAAMVIFGSGATAQMSTTKPSADIVDTAVSAGSFKTLVAAVQAAGLVDTLKGTGPFTVFAPTDDAFAKLPPGTLESLLKPENKSKLAGILTFHVVPGKQMAANVIASKTLKTVQGQELAVEIKDGKAYVNGAQIVKTDIVTSNGVIHVIDAVVLPK